MILGYLRNNPNDRLDTEGIDFLVVLKNGLAVPLQVKTERRNDQCAVQYRHHLRKHGLVRFLIAVPIYWYFAHRDKLYDKVRQYLRAMLRLENSDPQ